MKEEEEEEEEFELIVENKEKRCKVCGCNLIITRKYRFFNHNRGRTYHICLDCDEECQVEWVNVENHYLPSMYQIRKSVEYDRLVSKIEKLRGLLQRKQEWIDNVLLRSLDD
tara:strand:+ start:388 stop:723 length:336 start_codon:yes stop_codon:yes gene_type:complete